ncbi:MAG: hypothetical protein LBH14_07595 [Desulfobulbaceae bacterium]|jgi:hypothetical protein|nr:hypothetical protein [Desulfobulbaceae bacterium]
MRKITVLAVIIVLLLIVGTLFFTRHRPSADNNPAAFLPADTVGYIDERQAQERGQRFLASPLGQAITAIDLPSLVRGLAAPENLQADLKKSINDVKDFLNSKLADELLGDRFVVALLPSRDWMKEPGVLPDLRRQLVLLCKPRHGVTAIDLLASVYSGNLTTETVAHGQYSLKRFKNDNISFVTCAVNGWLVVAFEERALGEALDTFDARTNFFAASKSFEKIVTSLPPESDQIVYLRLSDLARLTKDFLARLPAPKQAALAGQIDSALAGLDAFAYGSWTQNGVLNERMFVSFIPDKAPAAVKKILTTPPQKDGMLPHLRDNLVLYSYSGVSNWSAAFDSLEKEQGSKVETFAGHSLKELRQMLGDGPSRLFVRKGDGERTLPLPLVNFCVTAAEPEKLGDTAATLLARTGIKMTKGKFQDASYQVWNEAPGKNLRFYSALWRGQWCLGNSLDFFKEMAEPPPASASLLADKDFKVVDDGINQPAQSLFYVQVDQSLDLLHDACGWLATILAVQNKDLSAKAKLINERLIFPILEGAKMYRRSFSRAVVEGNMLRIDAKTSMAPVESK